jgi:hypothetical protein
MPTNGFGNGNGANGNGTKSGLPSFFVVGPPRTATTWLYAVLSECAWLSYPTKETRFFDKHFDRGLDWYQSHYRKVRVGRAMGEVAPTYFASPEARERIARLIPHAKVVCTFRHPVDRVISLYRLKRAYGLIPWDFEEALACDPELLESSRYATHLKGWRSSFGDSHVLVTLQEDIESDPQDYLDKLADFVGLARVKLLPSHLHRMLAGESLSEPRHYYWTRAAALLAEWSKAQGLDSLVAAGKRWGALKLFIGGGAQFAEISSTQRAKLRHLFRPEVEELEVLLNRDLSAWK